MIRTGVDFYPIPRTDSLKWGGPRPRSFGDDAEVVLEVGTPLPNTEETNGAWAGGIDHLECKPSTIHEVSSVVAEEAIAAGVTSVLQLQFQEPGRMSPEREYHYV